MVNRKVADFISSNIFCYCLFIYTYLCSFAKHSKFLIVGKHVNYSRVGLLQATNVKCARGIVITFNSFNRGFTLRFFIIFILKVDRRHNNVSCDCWLYNRRFCFLFFIFISATKLSRDFKLRRRRHMATCYRACSCLQIAWIVNRVHLNGAYSGRCQNFIVLHVELLNLKKLFNLGRQVNNNVVRKLLLNVWL